MSNRVTISIKREQELKNDFTPASDMCTSVYINCDSISSWIGYANNKEEVLDLIKPENLYETLTETLSCEEFEIFESLLKYRPKYYFDGEEFIYK